MEQENFGSVLEQRADRGSLDSFCQFYENLVEIILKIVGYLMKTIDLSINFYFRTFLESKVKIKQGNEDAL